IVTVSEQRMNNLSVPLTQVRVERASSRQRRPPGRRGRFTEFKDIPQDSGHCRLSGRSTLPTYVLSIYLGVYLGKHRGGLKSVDIAVALEISDIEREDAIDRVDAHDGNQAGIVDLTPWTR